MSNEAVLAETDAEVARALEGLITWIRQSRQPQDLSVSALGVLSRLEALGPTRVTELAEREGLSQPGTTTLVNRLVAADYATRGSDAADGRVVLVAITPEGVSRLHAYREGRSQLVASRLKLLSPADRDALQKALPALEHIVAE
ncbi:hypothetical protein AX769_05080 [Frondihabitans sp. PAMC 28766]|uniref:MarR family winged helix-turn-helix transcriptional regulator n=1 Tax=Frondihabitans sp. PAMC 28766 TaxID=1795630 RepID=UPI00078D74CF|nr:MarR family transcriptional regulator [Frondihabitans sp. PAMC 28766]AMM19628.1 hypothetical protein AX769_05080 [Frondihabitans sp. PAMC 28766]